MLTYTSLSSISALKGSSSCTPAILGLSFGEVLPIALLMPEACPLPLVLAGVGACSIFAPAMDALASSSRCCSGVLMGVVAGMRSKLSTLWRIVDSHMLGIDKRL
eukprot:9608004-Ditylum_brightwellii.AAC.1